jgi:hypothetical protein
MSLKDITLSEISWVQKDKSHVVSLRWRKEKKVEPTEV